MRTLVSEFTKAAGNGQLHVTLYRDDGGYVYERELHEGGAGSEIDTVMVLPFHEPEVLTRFIHADPYFANAAAEHDKLLQRLREDMQHGQ
jgi:hypothetical protein